MTDFEMKGSVLRKYHGAGGAVVIPDGVTEIYVWAFGGRDDITSVTFPHSLVKIGERAFQYCKGLTALDFPDSLREIGREAFAECTGLSSVYIPPSVTELDFHAFYDCTSLKHIATPANVLHSWPFPKTVESAELISGGFLSKGAFADFIHLRSVTLPNSLETIEEGAFSQCRELRKITLPDSLFRIGEKAFAGCTALSSIHIPASVVRIGLNAFASCTALEQCSFGDTERWCHPSESGFWPPYNDVEGEDLDLTDPQANVAVVSELTEKILFKKRSAPRPEPAKPRFLTPVSTRAEDGLFVQGQYFAYITPDKDTEAALWEQAKQFSLARTEVTEHDHDEYGRYTDVETKYYPLTGYRGLAAPYSSSNADIIVEDGRIVGLVFCRIFYGSRSAYDDYFIALPSAPEDRGGHLILLWADGRVLGENTTEYSDHSGRDFTDSSIEYKLCASPAGKTERNAHWD